MTVSLVLSCFLLATPGGEPRPWTLLVYGAADNDCDGPLQQHVDDVRRALDDDPGVEILLFVDRHAEHAADGFVLGEEFTGARLYRVRRDAVERLGGGEHFPSLTTDKETELDSGDPETLRRFLAWGKATAPAKRTALVIYGHANGASMCPDDETGRRMGFAELTEAASDAHSVDFLALELCAMGGVEIAYQWRPGTGRFSADVMLGVPNSGPSLDWHSVFVRVRSPGHASDAPKPHLDPAQMTAADLGRLVIEEVGKSRARAGEKMSHEAAGCYDLREAEAVKRALDALAVALAPQPDAREFFLEMRGPGPLGHALYYGEPFFVDAYDICRRIAEVDVFSEEARAAAERACEALDRFVLASYGMAAYDGFAPGQNGVFVVVPLPVADGEPWDGLALHTPLAARDPYHGRWAFLRDGATPANGVVENWFELVDCWFDVGNEAGGINGYRW